LMAQNITDGNTKPHRAYVKRLLTAHRLNELL
jgi:hypothetical protein